MRLWIGFLLFFSTAAQADILFAPSFTYIKYDTKSSAGDSENTRTGYDIRLGYFDKGGLYLGVNYSIFKEDDGSAESTQTSLGPTIGYKYKNGFYGMLTYFVQSEYDSGTGPVQEDGMGPQLDIGWMFNLSESVYLGPTITYRSVKYKKEKNAGVSNDVNITHTQINPYVSMWFRF